MAEGWGGVSQGCGGFFSQHGDVGALPARPRGDLTPAKTRTKRRRGAPACPPGRQDPGDAGERQGFRSSGPCRA